MRSYDLSSHSLCLLIISDGAVLTHRLPMTGRVVIGRAADSAISIPSTELSRHHVALDVAGSCVWLENLASATGTRIRDKAIRAGERHKLEAGDAIELGSTIAMLQYLPAPSAQARVRDAAVDLTAAAPVIVDAMMTGLFRIVDRLAVGSLPVLILGERGVGKEVVAEQLHARSPRQAKPLVRLDCAAFSEEALERELFGHVRGSFTAATASRDGLLVAADGGTLFLDEIGALPLGIQAKLLRFLETNEVLPCGSHVDVRFIAATNRDLASAIDRGDFRADLYHRLDGATLVVPPLRQRRSEIRPLALRFLARAARMHRIAAPVLRDAALAWLEAHPWPGNVRELRDTIERALLVVQHGVLEVEHLSIARVGATPTLCDDDPIRVRTLAALAKCHGNQTRTARELGIARSTLVKRLDAYGTPRPQKS